MKAIFLLYILTTPVFFHAQTTHYFNKLFDKNEVLQGFGAGLITHEGDYLLVAAHIGYNYSQNHLWLIKLDENGDTVETSTIFSGDSSTLYTGRNIVRYDFGQDKGYYFPISRSDLNTGNANTCESELYKVGADLKVIWKKNLGGSRFDTFDAITMTSKNELVMAGQSASFGDPNYGNAFVVKTDTAGKLIWKVSIGELNKYERFYGIDTTADGGIVLAGLYGVEPQQNIFAIKLKSNGSQQWRKNYGDPLWDDNSFARIKTLKNGDCLLTTALRISAYVREAVIIRIAPDGTTIWQKSIPDDDGGDAWFWGSTELPDGSLVMVGGESDTVASSIVERATLTKTDSEGNLIWQRLFYNEPIPNHYFFGMLPTADAGFLMHGFGYRPDNYFHDAWAVKVDSMGCLEPGCATVSVEETLAEPIGVSVFPNPANDWVQIDCPTADLLGYRLIDPTGRVLGDLQFYRADAVRSHRVSLKNLPAGPLFLAIRTTAGWVTRVVIR